MKKQIYKNSWLLGVSVAMVNKAKDKKNANLT